MVLASFTLTGVSQTGIHKGVLGTPELRKTGLVIRPEIGYAMLDSYSFFQFATNVGCQVSPCVYVGAGIGLFAGQGLFVPIYSSFRWNWLKRPSSPFLELDLGVSYGKYREYGYYDSYYGSYNEGYNNGYNNGYNDGYNEGYYEGYNEGYNEGYYDPSFPHDPYYYPDGYHYYEYHRDYSEWMAYGRIAIGYDIKNFDIKLGVPAFIGSHSFVGLFMSLGYNFMPRQ